MYVWNYKLLTDSLAIYYFARFIRHRALTTSDISLYSHTLTVIVIASAGDISINQIDNHLWIFKPYKNALRVFVFVLDTSKNITWKTAQLTIEFYLTNIFV